MSEDTITAVEVQETQYGERIVLDSPYDAKEFIKAMPWNTTKEEIEEHGSLEAKLEGRGVAGGAVSAATDFGFSDDFSSHVSWEPDATGPDEGAWMIDLECWSEAKEFFEFCGFDVEEETDL